MKQLILLVSFIFYSVVSAWAGGPVAPVDATQIQGSLSIANGGTGQTASSSALEALGGVEKYVPGPFATANITKCVTIPTGQTRSLESVLGISASNQVGEIFILGNEFYTCRATVKAGYNAVDLWYYHLAIFTTTKDTADKINLFSDGDGTYSIQNNTGVTSFFITWQGSR